MNNPPDALLEGFRASATSRYLWVAGYTWVLYDWLISLGQEIDLVWGRRSGAWRSTFLYCFIRYYGIAIITFNVIVVLQSNWSVGFCHVYFYLLGIIGLGQMCAVQSALLLRLYVMYHRSLKVVAISIILFVIELVSMVTLWVVDVHDFIVIPPPTPATGCIGLSRHPALAKFYWCISLAFETYMFTLALFSAYSHWKASGTRRPNVLTILIRDSLLWYFFLGASLFLNALGVITGLGMLFLVGITAMQATATIGGSRFLLNLRAAYFSSMGNPTSTRTGYSRSTGYTQTSGTVGVFRPAMSDLKDTDDHGGEDEAGSIEMGVWANNDNQDDRPASSPAITLRPISPGGKRQRTYSTSGSSSIELREPDNTEGLGVSASDLSEPAHSSTKLWRPAPKTSDSDVI